MYRSRLGTDLSNITLDYVSSIDDDSQIALYDIIGSQAHTVMLLENKIITKNDAKKILSSLENLKNETFDSSSGAEDIHELIESLVIKKSGMTKEALEKATSELSKLKLMSPMSAEATVSRNYLDWLVKLPWKNNNKLSTDINKAKKDLNYYPTVGWKNGLKKTVDWYNNYLDKNKNLHESFYDNKKSN